MTKRSWVQDPITHKLIPKGEYQRPSSDGSPYIQGDTDAFISPITKEVITGRKKLRDHMKEHGVTDSRDYSAEYVHKRRVSRENEMTGNTEQARQERRELISRELDKQGIKR